MSNVKQLKDATGNSFSPKTSIDALTTTVGGGGGGWGKFLTTNDLGDGSYNVSLTEIHQNGTPITPVNDVLNIEPDIVGAHATSVPSSQNATATIDSNKTLQLEIPRGANGTDGHNPNLGTFVTSDSGATFTPALPSAPSVTSDYIVVVDKTDENNVTSTIWTWDTTLATPAWASTGRDANMAYFGSGELLSDVDIVNDLTTGGEHDVLSAEQGQRLNTKIGYYSLDASTTQGTIFSQKIYGDFKSGDTIYISFTGASNFDGGINIRYDDTTAIKSLVVDFIEYPIILTKDTSYVEFYKSPNGVISTGSVFAKIQAISSSEECLTRLNLFGLHNLSLFVDNGVISFENGAFNNNGADTVSSIRLRCIGSIPSNIGYIAVPDGFQIVEVFYYSSWESNDNFTLKGKLAIGNNGVKFVKDFAPYVRFSIKKVDNSNITPSDLLSALPLISPKIDNVVVDLNELAKATLEAPKQGTFTEPIVTFNTEISPRVKQISISSVAKLIGKNLLDATTFNSKKIINDSGTEVDDNSSSYYSFLIPCTGKTLVANFSIQRIYKYSSNGTFLGRDVVLDTQYQVPMGVAFVQIQVQKINAISDGVIIFKGSSDLSFKPFYLVDANSITELPEDAFSIYNTDGTDVTVTATIHCKAVLPAVKAESFWEPATVTNDYSCTPLGQDSQYNQNLNTLGLLGFYSTYFDIYIGEYADGYSVKKFDFGLDSAAPLEGHIAAPIYYYEFAPKYYTRTVLLSAGMNICEMSGYFGLAYFIANLMEHTETGMASLYATTRFVVLPLICPSGVEKNPLPYRSANNFRINKNFEHNGSWAYNHDRTLNGNNQYEGPYPDSEIETKILKLWYNKYQGADFYMDCHSDTQGSASQVIRISTCFCSDNATKSKLESSFPVIQSFYETKGYINPVQDAINYPDYTYFGSNLAGKTYPKTGYAKEVCGIPALMHEQYPISTAYGSNGSTNNDDYGIKNYVALIRWYCLVMCEGGVEFIL